MPHSSRGVGALEFVPLARVRRVEVYAARSGYVSFFSSPFTPHLLGAAVDISDSLDFGEEAPSPGSGTVERVVEIDSGPGRFERTDYMISIVPEENPELRVKLMHVIPSVSPGERIEVGDPLGCYSRTNYFAYHNLPHVHVEVCEDPSLRPSSALELELCLDLEPELAPAGVGDERLVVEVVDVREDFAICRPVRPRAPLGEASGALGLLNGELGVGLGHLGLIFLDEKPVLGSAVHLCGALAGYVARVRDWYAMALPERRDFDEWLLESQSIASLLPGGPAHTERSPVEVISEEVPLAGLELLISRECAIKLIPRPRHDLGLEQGDAVTIRLRSRRP